MAFSAPDLASAHSLWLQLRSTKRSRRHRWRSDWTPVWVFVLLFSLLLIVYTIMPSNDAAEQADQTAHKQSALKNRSMESALER